MPFTKGYRPSPETIEKLRRAATGQHASPATRVKMRASSLGKPKTSEHAAHISRGRMGIVFSAETRAKMSAAKKGLPSWNTGKTMSVEACRKNSDGHMGQVAWNKGIKTGLGPWRGVKRGPQSQAWKDKIAASNRKPKTPEHAANILAGRWHGPRPDYHGVLMRSSYEVRFATACDAVGVTWHYEPKRFDLGTCSYLPDFYLPMLGIYVEVKGYFSEESQHKVALFRSLHPEFPLVVVMKHTLNAMEVLHGSPGVEDQLNGLVAQECAIATA